MYSEGWVIDKASLIDPEISPTPLSIWTEGQKVQNLASFSTSLNFEQPAFDNAAQYLNCETNLESVDDCPMSSPSLGNFGPRTPKNSPEKCLNP